MKAHKFTIKLYFDRRGRETGASIGWTDPSALGKNAYGQCAGCPLDKIGFGASGREPSQEEIDAFRAGFEAAMTTPV